MLDDRHREEARVLEGAAQQGAVRQPLAVVGDSRGPDAPRALDTRNSEIARLSLTGSLLGIAQTAVNPPAAAARRPVATVSAYSRPGSRRCACRSMKPGSTSKPLASKTSASAAGRL